MTETNPTHKVLLAIDIGNTKVAIGVFRQDKIIATWHIATDTNKMIDEYAALLLNLLYYNKKITASDIEGAILCSVVPPLTPLFEQLCQQHLDVAPMVVGAGTRTGIRILMNNPKEVGGDRVANAIAGHKLYGGPLIIIDMGTATTFDVVSQEGDYLGGAIAPGMGIAAEALNRYTAQLPRVKLTAPSHVVGKNTISAMQSGIVFGYIGLIEGIIGRISNELGSSPRVIATGGLAEALTKITPAISDIDPDLTLKGLYFIYQRNKPQVH
ncbi:MAG: type III pantothenate kinase [Dehalococcoidia bacterium]|nr:type III pantothenate kinase [Dehalococcoidia bacterium]